MDYEIIALDIDGTLTNSKKELTDRTKNALIAAQQCGKKVILASGRHDFGMREIVRELELEKYGGYVMAFNGGKIINAQSKEIIASVNFPHEYIQPIYECLNDSNITVMTFENDTIITNQKVNPYTHIEAETVKMDSKTVSNFLDYVTFDVHKLLLVGEPEEIDRYQAILTDKFKGYLDMFKSCPFFLEVMPFGVNKGASLAKMLPQIGYKREQLIAFGDSYNDMTMIGYAGCGVCMENGEKDVKKIADIVADSNDKDGVAKIIEKYVLL